MFNPQIPNPKFQIINTKKKNFCHLVFVICAYFVIYALAFEVFAQEASGTKKVVMIIAHQGFRDEELLKPREILEDAGVLVKVASSYLTPAQGMLGAQVRPDMLIEHINIDDFDGIIFVGGVGASEYWDDPVALRLAQDAYSNHKLVAAICIAPVTLANAGILSGKKATVFESEKIQLTAEGALYTGKSVEQDGLIITANGPEAAKEFGRTIVSALTADKESR